MTIEINVSGYIIKLTKLEKRFTNESYRTKRGGTIYEKKGRDTYGSFAYSSDDVRLLAGCQTGGTDSGENKGGEKTESGKDSGKTKIAFIPQLVGIPYFSAMEKGGERAAADLGVDYLYTAQHRRTRRNR